MARVQLSDGYDADQYRPSDLAGSKLVDLKPEIYVLSWSADRYFMAMTGQGLTYGGPNGALLVGGVVTGFTLAADYGRVRITEAHADAATLGQAYASGDPTLGARTLLAGDDIIEELVGAPPTSTPNADEIYLSRGWGGNDLMTGGGTKSSFFGGEGNDTLQAKAGDGNYLRGDEGNDTIVGAAAFDDINGNMGDDTAAGGAGDDWVVGGKDNDSLSGEAGGDLVYGNLGNDICEGGDGNDIVRGGQDNDVVGGGAGDDFVSGDRGDDTMSGGTGADIFHTFAETGIDRVTDFNLAQGDRVMVDPGPSFTIAQVGADTVISMAGGGQMILVGVQVSTLTPGWVIG